MILDLSDEQKAYRKTIAEFAASQVAPRAAAIDESGEHGRHVVTPENHRRAHAQSSRRFAPTIIEDRLGRIDFGERPFAALVVGLAVLGERFRGASMEADVVELLDQLARKGLLRDAADA